MYRYLSGLLCKSFNYVQYDAFAQMFVNETMQMNWSWDPLSSFTIFSSYLIWFFLILFGCYQPHTTLSIRSVSFLIKGIIYSISSLIFPQVLECTVYFCILLNFSAVLTWENVTSDWICKKNCNKKRKDTVVHRGIFLDWISFCIWYEWIQKISIE